MGNDIEIRVRVANNTASGLAAVNRSLNNLRDQARDAGRGLDGLTERATAASLALRALKDSAQDAARALRSLNTASRTADTRMGAMSDRSRTLRRDTDDLDGSMRRLTGTMGQLRGNNGNLRVTMNDSGNGMDNLRKAAMMLAPALIPIAASAVPIATNLAAAGAGVAAFGLAIAGQLVEVKNASDAQQKYSDAVKKHGAASKEAGQAEALYLDQIQNMDPATRKAAAALSAFKDQYKQWSKTLAGDTMPVFTKGLAVAGALFPKLTPAVKGASEQLNRFMNILGGSVASGGFSKFMDSFAKFSTGALAKANDALVHFMRTMSGTGSAGAGKLSEFMDYVRKAGPQVGDTLLHLAEALTHIVVAASDTGLSMLSFVNAIAKLVAAVPTGVLSTFLQFAMVLKTVKMAAAGMAALGGLSSVATAIGAMRTAAAGATGPLASLSAAFGALSRSAKVALIGTGIGLLVAVLARLQQVGKTAPPDIDRMTTAIGNLGRTGQVTGEAVRVFGKGLEGLAYAADRVGGKSSGMDKFNDVMNTIFTLGMAKSNSLKEAEQSIDALDKGLANLVRGGKAKLAAAALKELQDAYAKKGGDPKKLAAEMDDYKSALADAALEQKLTADSMGLFGDAAAKASAKLADQKASADGLRQSIQALNDVQRQGLGGMIGFEAAIDAAAKAAKENHGALSMTNGVLNLGSEKARNAASALQDLADKTDAAAASARESGSSWETVNGIYSRGRSQLIKSAEAMGLTRDQAAQLASQILKIPDKTATIKMNDEDAKAGLNAFNAAVKRTPGSKSVTLKTLSSSAEAVLEAFGYKVKRLPDGSVRITAKTGGALSGIRSVAGAIAALHDKTVTLTSIHNIITNSKTYRSVHDIVGATGGLYTGKRFRYADGGLVQGPGTGTSDDVPAPWLSNGEFVIRAAAVKKYGEGFLQRINDGQYDGPKYARGGKVSKAQQRAKAQAQAEEQARHDAWSQLTISRFGRMAGYQRSEFGSALGKPDSVGSLVNALNQWRGIIQKATHGRTETRLLKQLDSAGKSLIKWEKQLTSVTKSLESAKSKLSDLKNAAAQLRDSVKGNLLSSANITRGAGPDSTVTLSSIRSGMRTSRDKVTAFAAALKQLRAKGFSKSIIQQVAEAGVDGGGLETAGALLQASASEVKSINQTQADIEKAAGSAGKTAADAVYEKAIKEQTKVVDKLSKEQDKLRKAMDKMTKAMEKAIEKAFGHKAAGGIVGAAATGGSRGGWTLVGEQEPELVRLPYGSRVYSGPDTRRLMAGQAPWTSMLNSPRRSPAVAATGGGAGQEQVVVLEIRAGDSSRYSEFLVAELRKAVKVRGSIEATFAPPRGR
ncbi:phage tail protein [Streptomyces sp. NPDC093060]|uniref:phage tail protein n=1 Tax=Streptomyces sp. NPDC093060 TaxID=3366019 RepID=UPI0038013ACF